MKDSKTFIKTRAHLCLKVIVILTFVSQNVTNLRAWPRQSELVIETGLIPHMMYSVVFIGKLQFFPLPALAAIRNNVNITSFEYFSLILPREITSHFLLGNNWTVCGIVEWLSFLCELTFPTPVNSAGWKRSKTNKTKF